MNTYTIGQQVRMEMILRDFGDALTSGTVTCEVRDPSGNIAAATVTNADTGVYHAFVTIDEAGVWQYRFESVGATISAGEGSWTAATTVFP